MKGYFRYFCQVVFVSFILVLAINNVLAQNSVLFGDRLTKHYFREKAFTELERKAQIEGKIRVIVGLDVATKPEGELSLSERSKQHASIRQTQHNFLQTLKNTHSSNIIQYEFIPYLAFETDASEIQKMRANENVVSLEEDMMMKPALEQSLAIVGALASWNLGFSGNGKTIAV